MLSVKIIRKLRDNHAEADKNFSTDSSHHFIVFSLHYIISTTIDYMHQLCSLYAKLPSHLLTVRERGRVGVNVQGTVFTLARLKIVPTIKNLYHIQCQKMLTN